MPTDETDNLVVVRPKPALDVSPAADLAIRPLFPVGPSASTGVAVYAGRQAADQTTKPKQVDSQQLRRKSIPLSLNPNIKQHIERWTKHRRRSPSAWRQYYAEKGEPCPPDCGACHLATKHYGTPFRFFLTLTFPRGMLSAVDVFLDGLSPVAFYMCHFEKNARPSPSGDEEYHAHIAIGGIHLPFLRALVRVWPYRTWLRNVWCTWGLLHYISTDEYDARTSRNYRDHWRPPGKNVKRIVRRDGTVEWQRVMPTSRPGWSKSAQSAGGRARAAKWSKEQRRAHALKMVAAKKAKRALARETLDGRVTVTMEQDVDLHDPYVEPIAPPAVGTTKSALAEIALGGSGPRLPRAPI